MHGGTPLNAVSTRFFRPSLALAPLVSTIYLTEVSLPGGDSISDMLHPEWANLRITTDGAIESAPAGSPVAATPRLMATGPTCRATQFRTAGMRTWGIGLLPLGWAQFARVPADIYAERVVAAGDDPAFAHLVALDQTLAAIGTDPAREAAAIDAHFAAMLGSPTPDAARILAVHSALVDSAVDSVAALSERAGIAPRTLERVTLRAFGFAPKLLLRRQRFLRSLAQFMLDPSLTWLATLDWQYHDQAHFVRDFHRFMGMSPSAYAALPKPVLGAAVRARAEAMGQAVQALHQPGAI